MIFFSIISTHKQNIYCTFKFIKVMVRKKKEENDDCLPVNYLIEYLCHATLSQVKR